MPGIDKSRFTNVSENEDELLCNICEAIFVDPVVTPCCQQTYCQTCIKDWIKERKTCPNDKKPLTPSKLTQPPRLVFNLLNRLKIKCDFQLNGCNEEIIFNRYKQHVKDCRFNPLAKCTDCGELNGERYGHNCVVILVANNKCLEISNKNSERERLKLKKKLEENTEKLIEINDQLLEANNELGEVYKELAETNKKLEESESRNKTVNELNEKYRSANKLNNEKLKTVNELSEELARKEKSIEIFKSFCRELNEENQKLEKVKRVFNQNIFTEFDKQFYDLKNYVLKIEETLCELKNVMKTQNEHNNVNIIDKKTVRHKIQLKNITLTSVTSYFSCYSNPFTINGFLWKIRIIKETDSDYLGIYLVCDGDKKSIDWLCNATVEFRVIQQIENRDYYALKCEHLFTIKENNCGFSKFMPWSIISDNENCYIKGGIMLLEVFVRCGQRMSSDESESVSKADQIREDVVQTPHTKSEARTSSSNGSVMHIDLNDVSLK